MGKMKTVQQFQKEDTTATKQARTPQQMFAWAKQKVFTLHSGLFRRLAEHDQQKDAG